MSGIVHSATGRLALGLLLLLFRRGKENVIEYQPVAGRVLVQREIRGGVFHRVLVIFGVVAAVKRKRPSPEIAVDVLHLAGVFLFSENGDAFLDVFLPEGRRLAEEPRNHVTPPSVVLMIVLSVPTAQPVVLLTNAMSYRFAVTPLSTSRHSWAWSFGARQSSTAAVPIKSATIKRRLCFT